MTTGTFSYRTTTGTCNCRHFTLFKLLLVFVPIPIYSFCSLSLLVLIPLNSLSLLNPSILYSSILFSKLDYFLLPPSFCHLNLLFPYHSLACLLVIFLYLFTALCFLFVICNCNLIYISIFKSTYKTKRYDVL